MSYRDLKTVHERPFIQAIKLKHIFDNNPDLSFLEQDYFNDKPEYPLCSQKENEKYKKQDKARLDAYNNDKWFMMGIVAETNILVPQNSVPPSYRIVPVTSGGLWGIESDCDAGYIKDTELDQIEDLKKLLAVFNVHVDDDVEIIQANEVTYE